MRSFDQEIKLDIQDWVDQSYPNTDYSLTVDEFIMLWKGTEGEEWSADFVVKLPGMVRKGRYIRWLLPLEEKLDVDHFKTVGDYWDTPDIFWADYTDDQRCSNCPDCNDVPMEDNYNDN